jgi:hypothetical protein
VRRYIKRDRTLRFDEAIQLWKARVDEARGDAEEAMNRLDEVIAEPFPVTKSEYVAVMPGEAGYDDAPFEDTMAGQMNESMGLLFKNSPNPFMGLIPKGNFPADLGVTVTKEEEA